MTSLADSVPARPRARRVLLVGARTPVALEVARGLHAVDVEVIGADCFPINVCRASRAVLRTEVLPSPRFAPVEFGEALARLVARDEIDVVVPVGEEIFAVADARARLQALGARVEVPSRAALEEMHDKGRFVARVRSLAVAGVRAPETWDVAEHGAGRGSDGRAARDIIVKARRSRFGSAIHVVRSGEVLPETVLTAPARWIGQERIEGEELSTLAFARAGRLVAHVTYRPLLRVERGPAYCFEAVRGDVATRLQRFSSEVAAALCWDGPLAFDVIIEPSGVIVPLECNPRLTSGVHFLSRLGPALLGSDALVEVDDQRPCMHALVMLTLGLAQVRSLRAATRWLELFRRSREVVWQRGDWLPFPAQLATFPQVARVAREHGVPIRDATTWLVQMDAPGEDGSTTTTTTRPSAA